MAGGPRAGAGPSRSELGGRRVRRDLAGSLPLAFPNPPHSCRLGKDEGPLFPPRHVCLGRGSGSLGGLTRPGVDSHAMIHDFQF